MSRSEEVQAARETWGEVSSTGAPRSTVRKRLTRYVHSSTAEDAFAAGASADEIVDVLFAIGPVIGSARLGEAAAEVARPVGYDIDGALESLGELRWNVAEGVQWPASLLVSHFIPSA